MVNVKLSELFKSRPPENGTLKPINKIIIDKPELIKNQECAVAYAVYAMTRFDITREAYDDFNDQLDDMEYDVYYVDYKEVDCLGYGLGSRILSDINHPKVKKNWKKNTKYYEKLEHYITNELYNTEHFWSFYTDVKHHMTVVILYAAEHIILEKAPSMVSIFQLYFEDNAFPLNEYASEVLDLHGAPDFRD